MENGNLIFEEKLKFCLKCKKALASVNIRRKTEYTFLKPMQIKCIKSALETDTLVILPTGYGKSLVYELIQIICNSKMIIISPINAIIDEQIRRLDQTIKLDEYLIKEIGNKSPESISRAGNAFREGFAYFIIGHPEHFLSKTVCDILSTSVWRSVSHIVVDEAHCVVTWGREFRPAFFKIVKLRSIFPNAKLVAMTATATVAMQKEIGHKLQMQQYTTIAANPGRENIKLSVTRREATTGSKKHVDDSIQDLLRPFVSELIKKKREFEKTIVYSSLKNCGLAYELVNSEARRYPADFENIIQCVSQYHAPCTEKMKQKVSEELSDTDGKIQLLFATEAYGMGADAPDVRRIIHIGPPNSLETYVQEIGRAGRDGKSSTATLYYNASDIAANRENLQPEMKEFCLTYQCRRVFLCRHFGFERLQVADYLHDCCDNCEKQCNCVECVSVLFGDLNDTVSDSPITNQSYEETDQSSENLEILRNALEAYLKMKHRRDINAIYTGLSASCIEMIIENRKKIKQPSDLQSLLPHLSEEIHINNIFHIITYTRELK